MKKSLLIWNIVITVVALALIFGACTSDSRVPWLVNQDPDPSGCYSAVAV